MPDYSIKLAPTRDQRREIDRAAKAAGFRNSGPWALSKVLEAARAGLGTQSAPAGSKSASALPSDGAVAALHGRSVLPLVKSFDPDA